MDKKSVKVKSKKSVKINLAILEADASTTDSGDPGLENDKHKSTNYKIKQDKINPSVCFIKHDSMATNSSKEIKTKCECIVGEKNENQGRSCETEAVMSYGIKNRRRNSKTLVKQNEIGGIKNTSEIKEGKNTDCQRLLDSSRDIQCEQNKVSMAVSIDKDRFLEISSGTCSASSTASSTSNDCYYGARPKLPPYLRVRKEVACSDSEQVQKLTHSRKTGAALMAKTQSNSIDVALLGSGRSFEIDKRKTRDHSKESKVGDVKDTNQKKFGRSSEGLAERALQKQRKHSLGNAVQKDEEQSNQNGNTRRRVKFSSSQPTLLHCRSLDLSVNEDLTRPRSRSVAENTDEHVPRLVFVGDQYVGKTALITRFTQGLFNNGLHSYQVAAKVIKHTKSVFHKRLGRQVRLQFWDIDGGETKTSIKCAQRAHAVVVVYDVTNRSSFDKAQMLLESINPRVTAMLIGNKLDLKDLRRVSYEEGRILAKIHRVQYVETSVKYNHNIEETLQLLLTCIPKEYLVRGVPLVRHRSRSDSVAPVIFDSDKQVCRVCQTELSHRQRKDEIDI